MQPLTLQQIADSCKAQCMNINPDTVVTGISTDTRSIVPGDLFIAIKGENFDAHDFVNAALDADACAVMISKRIANIPALLVENTLTAYGHIGGLARSQVSPTVFAITGSAGKTTTKGYLGSIVSLAGKSLVSPGNENNEIGVPRLLLQLTPEHEYCVVEMGMRGPGEVAALTQIAKPQIGIITNIGDAHIGRLGSREAIAKAKAELLSGLPEDGIAVLNADDFFFGLLNELSSCKVYSVGCNSKPEGVALHVQAVNIKAGAIEPATFTLLVDGQKYAVKLRLPGVHNIHNALAATAAALAARIDMDLILEGLEEFSGEENRSQIIEAPGGFRIINDTYNASPTSTPQAIKMLEQCPGRRFFVFGDMLELGYKSERAHREIGKLCVRAGIDWLITIGSEAAYAAEEADLAGLQADVVPDTATAVALLRPVLEANDTVLVKASHSMALENVVKGLLTDA